MRAGVLTHQPADDSAMRGQTAKGRPEVGVWTGALAFRSACGSIMSIGETRRAAAGSVGLAGEVITAGSTDWVAVCCSTGTFSRPICVAAQGMSHHNGRPTAVYLIAAYIYDLAQLIHQQELAPVTIVAPLGNSDHASRTGIYPAEREESRRSMRVSGIALAERYQARQATDRRPHALNMNSVIIRRFKAAAFTPRSTRR